MMGKYYQKENVSVWEKLKEAMHNKEIRNIWDKVKTFSF